MRLTYWIAHTKDIHAHPCYAIRAETKKNCLSQLKEYGEDWGSEFHPPKKVEVLYTSGFDLMAQCLSGEDRASFESRYSD